MIFINPLISNSAGDKADNKMSDDAEKLADINKLLKEIACQRMKGLPQYKVQDIIKEITEENKRFMAESAPYELIDDISNYMEFVTDGILVEAGYDEIYKNAEGRSNKKKKTR
jgi:ribonucleotide reductase beta subunit family protein with ferritin-like domain